MADIRNRIEQSNKGKTSPTERAINKALQPKREKVPDPNKEYVYNPDGTIATTKDGRFLTKGLQEHLEKSAVMFRKFQSDDSEEGRQRRREASAKAAETRAKRKSMRDSLEKILQSAVSPDSFLECPELFGVPSATIQEVMLTKMAEQALNGNVNAFLAVRDTAGDKPIERQQTEICLSDADRELLETVNNRLIEQKPQDIVVDCSEIIDID